MWPVYSMLLPFSLKFPSCVGFYKGWLWAQRCPPLGSSQTSLFPLAVPLLLSACLSPLFSSYCFSAVLPFWQPLPQPSAHPTVAFPPLPATPFPTVIWIWDYCHQVFSKDLETPKLGIRTNSILKVPSISNSRKSVASFWGQDKLNPLKMGSEMKKEPTVSHKPVTVNCSARRLWIKSWDSSCELYLHLCVYMC